jgi:ElaB/YqjD/DUF883 family membrane-anchored ribosome-binding protein
MKTNSTTLSPDNLLNDLHGLVGEAEKIIGDPHNRPTEEVLGALRARFESAHQSVADLCAGAKKKVLAGAKYTDESIRENPYQSIAIAAGIGLLIGVLAGRYSK